MASRLLCSSHSRSRRCSSSPSFGHGTVVPERSLQVLDRLRKSPLGSQSLALRLGRLNRLPPVPIRFCGERSAEQLNQHALAGVCLQGLIENRQRSIEIVRLFERSHLAAMPASARDRRWPSNSLRAWE